MSYLNNDSLDKNSYFQPSHLEKKLLKSLSKKINIVTIDGKKIVKTVNGVILRNDLMKIEKKDIISRAALVITDKR